MTKLPSATKDTRIEIEGRTLSLRPAAVRTSYAGNASGGERVAILAKRSGDTWLVVSRNGQYLGVLEESTGDEPWTVSPLATSTSAIGDAGARVRSTCLSGATWQAALGEGARCWW